jgi:NAD+ kinase
MEGESMQRIGIFYNPQSPAAERSANDLDRWLRARGLTTWCCSRTDDEAREHLRGFDLLVCLGGDGTALRGAGLAISYNIPLLPVALGHLSFMAEVMPQAMFDAVERVLAGDFWLETRALAETHVQRADAEPERFVALNEVLIGRGDLARVIEVAVRVDGTPMTTYHADGVLVATATGSTAYGLAAGGPVLDPRSQALVLVPVAAHLHNVPSLVLHEDARLELEVTSRYPAAMAIDGRVNRPLHPGDRVRVQRAPEVARFVRLEPPSYFYQTLTRRLRREDQH